MDDYQLDELESLANRGATQWNHANIIQAKRGIEELIAEIRALRKQVEAEDVERSEGWEG